MIDREDARRRGYDLTDFAPAPRPPSPWYAFGLMIADTIHDISEDLEPDRQAARAERRGVPARPKEV